MAVTVAATNMMIGDVYGTNNVYERRTVRNTVTDCLRSAITAQDL